MLSKKKILTLLFAITLILSVFISQSKSNSEKVLDSKAQNIPSPTLVYTPSITPQSAVSVAQGNNNLYVVEKVIDGDTISVSQNGQKETIRLIGINTPETVDPRRPVECFGIEASNKAKELLAGRKVTLEIDKTQGSRDKYNRQLAYIHREDGLFYNLWMIENGFAYEYTYDTPYIYTAKFKAAQESAQANKRGLWGESRCSEKGNTENIINNTSPNTPQGVGDKDCKDFTTHTEAQDFFVSQGGPNSDPHKLDSDGDGSVCESLP